MLIMYRSQFWAQPKFQLQFYSTLIENRCWKSMVTKHFISFISFCFILVPSAWMSRLQFEEMTGSNNNYLFSSFPSWTLQTNKTFDGLNCHHESTKCHTKWWLFISFFSGTVRYLKHTVNVGSVSSSVVRENEDISQLFN